MASASLPRILISSVGESTYFILRDKIISKEFEPGQRLDLLNIEEQLGISRTPVREALGRLESEGLVYVVPRAGTYVTNPTPDEIAESFDIRRILETFAIEQVVQRASDDDIRDLQNLVDQLGTIVRCEDRAGIYPKYIAIDHEFHQRLIELSGHGRLQLAHGRENVHAQMARVRYRRPERDWEAAQAAQTEHELILAALKARDVEAAKMAMDAHLLRAKRSLLEDINISTEMA